EAALVAEAHLAGGVNPVLAHAEVGRCRGAGRRRLHAGAVGLQRRAPSDRPVRADVVVVVAKGIQLALELSKRLGRRLLGQIALSVWCRRSTLPSVCGWYGREFLNSTL